MKKCFKMVELVIFIALIFISCSPNLSDGEFQEFPFLFGEKNSRNTEIYWGTISDTDINFKKELPVHPGETVDVNIIEGSVYKNPDSRIIIFKGNLSATPSRISLNTEAAKAVKKVISSGDDYTIAINGRTWSIGTTNNEFWRTEYINSR